MSQYKNVSVSQQGVDYITGATAKVTNDGNNIAISDGETEKKPVPGDKYLIKNSGGLFDTHGEYVSGDDPYEFLNVE